MATKSAFDPWLVTITKDRKNEGCHLDTYNEFAMCKFERVKT